MCSTKTIEWKLWPVEGEQTNKPTNKHTNGERNIHDKSKISSCNKYTDEKENIFCQVTNTPSLLSMKTHAKRETWRNKLICDVIQCAACLYMVKSVSLLGISANMRSESIIVLCRLKQEQTLHGHRTEVSKGNSIQRAGTEWRHRGLPLRKRALISLLVLMFLIISVNKTYRANRVAPYR